MRLPTLLVSGSVVVGAVVASATAFPVGRGSLGAGSAAVTRCQVEGFSTAGVVEGGMVTAVEVRAISAPCQGAGVVVRVALTDASGARVGDGSVTGVPGGTVTVPLATRPAVGIATTADVVLEGP